MLAQNSMLPRIEALGERWSMPAVSLRCLCWSLVSELRKRPAHARRRALSRPLLGAYGALQDHFGTESAPFLVPWRRCCISAIVDRRQTLEAAMSLVAGSGVEVWPLEREDVELARQLHEQLPALGARDLCHLASCRRRGVTVIKTFDQAFAAAAGSAR